MSQPEDYTVQQEAGIRQGGWLTNKRKAPVEDGDDFSTDSRRVFVVDEGSPKRYTRAITPDSPSQHRPTTDTLQFIRDEVIKKASSKNLSFHKVSIFYLNNVMI